jgi:hypothetical protein
LNQRARAHGLAAGAVLSWLHSRGRQVPAVSLHRTPDHSQEPEPNGPEAIEDAIRLVLGSVVAEMLHLGADGRHLAVDRDDVKRALALAGRLGDGDPVDHLEPVFDDLVATLASPKVRHTVAKLAGELVRAPGGELGADDVRRAIVLGMAETPADGDDQPAHPRTIWVR